MTGCAFMLKSVVITSHKAMQTRFIVRISYFLILCAGGLIHYSLLAYVIYTWQIYSTTAIKKWVCHCLEGTNDRKQALMRSNKSSLPGLSDFKVVRANENIKPKAYT